jgi:hypothetical protein
MGGRGKSDNSNQRVLDRVRPADKNGMGCFERIVCGWAVLAGVLLGETGTPPGSDACGSEIVALHGVWRSPQVYFPLYADWGTVTYLSALGAKAAGYRSPVVAVLPVYAAQPVHFRLGNFVFLSTGLIVEAGGEQELVDAIQAELIIKRNRTKKLKQPGWSPACAALPPGPPTSFQEAQQRLAAQVAEYARRVTPRLQRRDESLGSPSTVDPALQLFERQP